MLLLPHLGLEAGGNEVGMLNARTVMNIAGTASSM